MEPWTWLTVGIILLAAELFLPTGMYLLILGLSFIIVGTLGVSGILPLLGLTSTESQIVVAAIISTIMIFTVRNSIKKLFLCYGKKTASDIENHQVTITEEIPAGQFGKGELLGVPWTVRNESSVNLEKNKVYAVKKVEGITLIIGD